MVSDFIAKKTGSSKTTNWPIIRYRKRLKKVKITSKHLWKNGRNWSNRFLMKSHAQNLEKNPNTDSKKQYENKNVSRWKRKTLINWTITINLDANITLCVVTDEFNLAYQRHNKKKYYHLKLMFDNKTNKYFQPKLNFCIYILKKYFVDIFRKEVSIMEMKYN